MQECSANACYCDECSLHPEPYIWFVQEPYISLSVESAKKRSDNKAMAEHWERVIDNIWSEELQSQLRYYADRRRS